MAKFEGTVAFVGSGKSVPRTVEAEDLHSASQAMIDEFRAENPGKDCKLVHIRMLDPPVIVPPPVDA